MTSQTNAGRRVDVVTRSSEHNGQLLRSFQSRALVYGDQPYAGLLSPSSTLLGDVVVTELESHVDTLREWIAAVVGVYRELCVAPARAPSMLRMLEWGLTPFAIHLQRESAVRGELPAVGRLDCVHLGGAHYIGEVQWKGAGEGYWAGVEASYREVFPLQRDEAPFSDLTQEWARVFGNAGCSINTGRAAWMPSEGPFVEALRSRGVKILSLPPEAVQRHLAFDKDRPFVEVGGELVPLKHLYLDRLTEVMEEDVLQRLVRAGGSGELVLDPPPSYLYNQKLPLYLPYSADYRASFSDDIRRILIPSALVSSGRPEIPPELASSLPEGVAEQLSDLDSWFDISSLPKRARRAVVFKCASAYKEHNYGGRGVRRLSGEGAEDEATLEWIARRVVREGEPWIAQAFAGSSWTIPVAHQHAPEEMVQVAMFPKFGVYFDISGRYRKVIGGLTSWNTNWKVSGSSSTGSRRHVDAYSGAFRHDIRLRI